MATNLTYTLLVEKTRNYFSRNDQQFIDNIAFAIMLAQQRLARDLDVLGTLKVANGVFEGTALSDGVVDKPADWIEPIDFTIGVGVGYARTAAVYYRRYNYLRMIFGSTVAPAQPRFYADYDYWHWFLRPIPDQAYPFEVRYRAIPQLLDDATQENWFTRRVPDLLLYATLQEQAIFVKNEDKIKETEALYQERMSKIDRQALRNMSDNQEVGREAG